MRTFQMTSLLKDKNLAFACGIAIILFTAGAWVCSFYPYTDWFDHSGTVLGADYSTFYRAGYMYSQDASSLYDLQKQQTFYAEFFGHGYKEYYTPFRYPPLVGAIFSFFSRFPYVISFFLFLGISIGVLVYAVYSLIPLLVTEWLQDIRPYLPLIVFSNLTLLEALFGGQLTPYALCLICGMFALDIRGKSFIAGLSSALLLYKPGIACFLLLGLILETPVFGFGFLIGGIVLFLSSVVVVGLDLNVEFFKLLFSLANGTWTIAPPGEKITNALFWFSDYYRFPAQVFLGGIGTVLVYLAGGITEKHRRYALYLLINALCAPYVPVYDLALLCLIPILLWKELREWKYFPISICLLWFGGHLSQFLYPFISFHIEPLLLIAVLFSIWRHIGRRGSFKNSACEVSSRKD